MTLPGPPTKPGVPINYGDLFTLQDYLAALERIAPDTTYDQAVALLDKPGEEGLIEPFGMTEKGEWIYRFVPPSERLVQIIVYFTAEE